jgi:hypothetical protein
MSQVVEETESVASHSKVARVAGQAAGVGMALMGSSLASSEPHVDHGYAPARLAAVTISGLGWLVGGIAFPFGIWALVVIGGVLQIVALVVNVSMNAAGMGAKSNDDWAAAKAQAKAARAA